MIVITKRSLSGYILFILLIFGFLVGLGMVLLQDSPKDLAETFFFLSLLSFLALGIGTIFLAIHARNKKQQAIRLFISTPTQDQTMDAWVHTLGDLGRHLLNHQRSMVEYNHQLSRKVQGMNNLVRFVLRNFPEPLGVISLNGKVLYGSQSFFASLNTNPSDALGSDIKTYIPTLQFLPLVNKLQKSTGTIEQKTGGRTIQWYGVTGKRGELEYLLLDLGSGIIQVVPEAFEMHLVNQDPENLQNEQLNSWTNKLKKSIQWMLGGKRQ
jgi:PAS domain-containing protein